MTKILSINSSSSIKGGADRFFFELNKLLIEKGNQVITFSTYSKNCDAINSNSISYYTKEYTQNGGLLEKVKNFVRIFYSPSIVNDLKRVIKKEKPEIAHIHNIYHRIPYSIVKVLKKNNIKIIWWLHDYKWICPNHQLYTNGHLCTLCTDGKYSRAVKLRCQKGSFLESLIVTLFSSFIRFKKYSQYVDLFIAPSIFSHTIHKKTLSNSTHLHHFNYNYTDKTKSVKKDAGNLPFALFVGRIERNKGIKLMVDAFVKLNYPLKIIGDGNYKEEIIVHCNNDHAPNITFEGFKSKDEINDYYESALFTIIPSQWYEVFGLTILESFSFKKPVVAADIGAIPEIVEDKKSGLLFNPFDLDDLISKIDFMFNNITSVKEMGNYAYEKCLNKFSKYQYYERLQTIQNQLIN